MNASSVEQNTTKVAWDIRSLSQALGSAAQPPEWVIENLVMPQTPTQVSAHPHSVKSLSWLCGSIECAAGLPVWGHFNSKARNALYLESEDPPWLVEARIKGITKGLNISEAPGFHYVCTGPFDLVTAEADIRQLVEKYELNLLVISTLQNLLAGRNWESQKEIQPVMAAIVRISRECPVVLLTHSPWDRKQRRAAGSVTQTANFLTTLHYAKVLDGKTGETFAHVKGDSKAAGGATSFSLRLVTDGEPNNPASVRRVAYSGEGWPKGIGKAAVEAAIQEHPDHTAAEIAEMASVSRRYVEKIMRERKNR